MNYGTTNTASTNATSVSYWSGTTGWTPPDQLPPGDPAGDREPRHPLPTAPGATFALELVDTLQPN